MKKNKQTSKSDPVSTSLRKKIGQFKQYGYDLPASRRALWKLSGIRRGRILEVGTGKGHLTALLAQKGLEVISVDLDREALNAAKAHLTALELNQQVSLKMMNAEKLRFGARSFDHVISMDFFHHAKDPVRCLKEMMRVTRKTLIIADLNKNGMRIMDIVHKKEGKKHETPKVPFKKLKKYLLAHPFNVKSHCHPCHQVFVAQRRNS